METPQTKPPILQAKTGVIVGVPSVGWQSTLFLKHLMGLVMPLNTIVSYKFVGLETYENRRRPVAEAQNIMIHEAMREGAQFLLFIEEDVIAPGMAFRQLMATAGRNPDAVVVAGVVTSKTVPPEPMIYRGLGAGPYWDWKPGEIFEVDGVHTGFTLVRLGALKKLRVPTILVNDYPAPGEQTPLPQFFLTSTSASSDGPGMESNDIHFCTLLRNAGMKILVDANVLCGHFDLARHVLFGMPQSKPNPEMQEKAQVVNLGCGMEWEYIDGVKPLRVDLNAQNNPDFRADMRALPALWGDKFDIVYTSHTLEHFDRYDLPRVFAEMVRVTKPGGEIRIVAPSLEWAVEELVKNGGALSGRVIDVIWGGRSVPAVGDYPEMYHKIGLSQKLMFGMAKQFRLYYLTERYGYNQVYRFFKPPIAPAVRAWIKDKERAFNVSFLPVQVGTATLVQEESEDADAAQKED